MPSVELKPERPWEPEAEAKPPPKRLPVEYFGSIPAKLLDGIEIGDEVTVTFKGKVTGIQIHKDDRKTRGSLDVETKRVGLNKSTNAKPSEIEELAD